MPSAASASSVARTPRRRRAGRRPPWISWWVWAKNSISRIPPCGQAADLLDRGEVEAAAPDEWRDRLEEALARGNVSCTGARANERRPLPRQRGAFVVRQCAGEGDRQRAHLGRRAQPQVDPEDVAFGSLRGQQFHDGARIALRRLARLVALTARQGCGIEQQDGVDVGTEVELARAVLAERQRGEPGGLRFGHAAADRLGDRGIERAVGEGGEFARHSRQRKRSGKVADGQCEREAEAFLPQCDIHLLGARGCRRYGVIRGPLLQESGDVGPAFQRLGEERCVVSRPLQRAIPVGFGLSRHCPSPAWPGRPGQGACGAARALPRGRHDPPCHCRAAPGAPAIRLHRPRRMLIR